MSVTGPRFSLHHICENVDLLCQRALEEGKHGILLHFSSKSAALKIRSKIYTLRKELSRHNLLAAHRVFQVEMILREAKDGTATLQIFPHFAGAFATITTVSGKGIDLEMKPLPDPDELDALAFDKIDPVAQAHWKELEAEQKAEALNVARLAAVSEMYKLPQSDEEARTLAEAIRKKDEEWLAKPLFDGEDESS